MTRLSDTERLARMPLVYELVVKRGGGEELFRTSARGALVDVLEDARKLALARGGDRCEYRRIVQRAPAPPENGRAAWGSYVGERIEAGSVYSLIVRRDAPTAPPTPIEAATR